MGESQTGMAAAPGLPAIGRLKTAMSLPPELTIALL